MKRFILLFSSVFFLSALTFAQNSARDISQTPTNFDNPAVVHGAILDSPTGTLSESFEDPTFPPAGWTLLSPDGGTGWNRQLVGTSPIPGWNGGVITAPPGGGNAVAFCTWNTGGPVGNDQWLVSAQVTNVQAGDSLKFWLQVPGYTNQQYLDSVDVLISTTGNSVGDFNIIVDQLFWPAGSADTNWTQYGYLLTDFCIAGSVIYVAVMEHVAYNLTDGAAVCLDLVEVTSGGGGSNIVFFDDFEAYTAGQQLACQNPADWTTWSEAPCDPTEDPYVSDAYAYSGANSVNIVQNNDLVKLLGDLTSGKWGISFFMYIPTGQEAYFNTLSGFTGGAYEWAMEAYFYTGAAGSLNAGGTGVATFTFPYDTWFPVEVIVDLNNDMAEFWVDGVQVYNWQWTLGASGGGSALQLAANDFFGHAFSADWYFDDYQFEDLFIVPVELTSFAANVNNSGQVVLNWSTATELNNQMFEIQRSADNNQFVTIGYVDGQGTTTEPQQYSYVDRTVETGKYYYRLKQIDFGGQYEYSDVVEVDVNGPLTYKLEQNFPNPFNPSTVIKYSVANPGHVRLVVYNLVGEEVSVLVDGMVEAGFYQVSFDASNLPSGIYLYKLEAPGFVQIKKMMLMK